MPRPPRRFVPEGFYHIMSRGNNRNVVFRDDDCFRFYLLSFLDIRAAQGFFCSSFVLMPNHVHLLLSPGLSDLSHVMHCLNTRYAKYFCSRFGHIGHVWQGRFQCRTIEHEDYLNICRQYIENNPVRAGLVDTAEEWPYSSARWCQTSG
jgi:putative transposase